MYSSVEEFRVSWIFSTGPLIRIFHFFSWNQNAGRCTKGVQWKLACNWSNNYCTDFNYFTKELNSYAPEPSQLTQPSVTWCGRPPQEIIMCSATFVHKTWPEKAPQPTTDYGHMMANSLIICSPHSYPKPKLILLACFLLEIMVDKWKSMTRDIPKLANYLGYF